MACQLVHREQRPKPPFHLQYTTTACSMRPLNSRVKCDSLPFLFFGFSAQLKRKITENNSEMAPSFPGGPRPLPAGRGKPSGPPSSLPARGGGVSDVLIIHIFVERALRGGRRRRHISHVHSRTHMHTRSPGRRSHCARGAPGSRAPLWGGPPRTGEEWRRLPLSPPQVASPSNPRKHTLASRSNFLLQDTLVFPTSPSPGLCVCVWGWGEAQPQIWHQLEFHSIWHKAVSFSNAHTRTTVTHTHTTRFRWQERKSGEKALE